MLVLKYILALRFSLLIILLCSFFFTEFEIEITKRNVYNYILYAFCHLLLYFVQLYLHTWNKYQETSHAFLHCVYYKMMIIHHDCGCTEGQCNINANITHRIMIDVRSKHNAMNELSRGTI